jgi:hypothetical protein
LPEVEGCNPQIFGELAHARAAQRLQFSGMQIPRLATPEMLSCRMKNEFGDAVRQTRKIVQQKFFGKLAGIQNTDRPVGRSQPRLPQPPRTPRTEAAENGPPRHGTHPLVSIALQRWPERFNRPADPRNAVRAGKARHDVQHARVDVRVLMRVEVRGLQSRD